MLKTTQTVIIGCDERTCWRGTFCTTRRSFTARHCSYGRDNGTGNQALPGATPTRASVALTDVPRGSRWPFLFATQMAANMVAAAGRRVAPYPNTAIKHLTKRFHFKASCPLKTLTSSLACALHAPLCLKLAMLWTNARPESLH